ncbi:MAG TPA: hypothetical protein VHN78_15525, partial [Chloroflexota bacterium]|nr:hypothetical protein [Chloroflexota bacterium]
MSMLTPLAGGPARRSILSGIQRPTTISARLPAAWTGVLWGLLAGAMAVLLLLMLPPLYALGGLGALGAAAIFIASPFAGLYLVVAAMIAEWPFQALKLAGAGLAVSAMLWALAGRRRLVPLDPLFWVLMSLIGLVWISLLNIEGPAALGPAVRLALTYLGYGVTYWILSTMSVSPQV